MTEIKIERKRSILPWVVFGIAVVAAIVYFFLPRSDAQPNNEDHSVALISVRENNATVNDFVQFVSGDSARMTLDHAYTNQAILKLSHAIDAMGAEVGFEVKADLNRVKELADKIIKDPFATTHADNIRRATDILASSLQRMQQSKFPELSQEAAQLGPASAAIDPQVLTLDQREAVKGFFSQAATLLEKMN